MKTVIIYGRKRNVLGIRTLNIGLSRHRWFVPKFRLILDGGETYESLYPTGTPKTYQFITKLTTITEAPVEHHKDRHLLTFAQGKTYNASGELTTYDSEDIDYLKAVQPTKEQAAKTKPRVDPGELERLKAFAQLSQREAICHILDSIPDMDEKTIIAGWLHVKGTTWADMKRQTGASKGTLSKRVNNFYRASKLPRKNRRTGGMRKPYQLDENRDAGTV